LNNFFNQWLFCIDLKVQEKVMEMSTVLEGLDLLMTFSKCTAQTSEISPGAVTILPLSSLTGPFMFRCFPMISSVILQTALESPFLAASPIIAAFFSRKSRLSPFALFFTPLLLVFMSV